MRGKHVPQGPYCDETICKYEGGQAWKNLTRSWLVPEMEA